MTDTVLLGADGTRSSLQLREPVTAAATGEPLRSRTAYAAAHVVPKAWADNVPGAPADLDWDATLAYRHHVWSYGLGVADAMDTAQRNMGLDTAATRELIARSAAEAQAVGGALVVGVNTDHLEHEQASLDEITDAYLEQLAFAEDAGAGTVLMASRHLARAANGPDDYRRVYDRVLDAAQAPVVLHWLGTAFDPSLAGYFGSDDVPAASDTLLRIMSDNVSRVAGVKMSLLDADAEIAVRRRLPVGTTMFTGDDFNYVDLIAGDEQGHSDALLGAFTAIAPAASAAIRALDAGDPAAYERILRPTEALSRQIFASPTYFYKTGIAFLSWLNGHQSAFSMVGGLHAARSLPHLSEIVRLADAAGALEQPELAAERWTGLLRTAGLVGSLTSVGGVR